MLMACRDYVICLARKWASANDAPLLLSLIDLVLYMYVHISLFSTLLPYFPYLRSFDRFIQVGYMQLIVMPAYSQCGFLFLLQFFMRSKNGTVQMNKVGNSWHPNHRHARMDLSGRKTPFSIPWYEASRVRLSASRSIRSVHSTIRAFSVANMGSDVAR